jgi:flagellar protein FlbT
MLAYIDPASRDTHHDAVVGLVGALIGAFATQEAKSACIRFASEIAQGDYYKALTAARELIGFENVATEAQAA